MSVKLQAATPPISTEQSVGPFQRLFTSEALVNDPDYLWGQTTFRGTRTLASTLFEYLADGKTIDDFIEEFPTNRAQVVRLLEEIKELLTP